MGRIGSRHEVPGDPHGRRRALARYRAERLLRNDFAGLRPRVNAIVRSRLRARGLELDAVDLDACYAQAWHGLYAALLRGEQIEEIAAWLVVVTFRRALDELELRARQDAARDAQGELVAVPGSMWVSGSADIVSELDDRARLRQVLEGLNGCLSPRERRAASLCYLQGLSRVQAARRLGVSEARMRKLMDGSPGKPGVAAKMGALLDTIGAGGWCEHQGSLMRAHAFGILDPAGERHALALAHLRECPACRALVLSLRGLAAILPPLPLSGALGAASTRAVPARATPVSARLSGVPGGRAPIAKLALLGATVLAAGGGYALLVGGTRSPTVRSAAAAQVVRPAAAARVVQSVAVARVPATSRSPTSLPPFQAPTSPRPRSRAGRPASARSATRREPRPARRTSQGQRRTSRGQLVGLSPGTTVRPPPRGAPNSQAGAALGEFTPEQPRRGR